MASRSYRFSVSSPSCGDGTTYLWPKLVINGKERYTIQLALANYSGEYSVDWNSLLAMSVISMIPVIIVFVTLQK